MARLHPNTIKFVLALLTLAALIGWGWHFWNHLLLTGSRALPLGWPRVLNSPARLEPFLMKCSLNVPCLKALHLRAL